MTKPLHMVMKDATRMRLPAAAPYLVGRELVMEYRGVGHRHATLIERYAVATDAAGAKCWQRTD